MNNTTEHSTILLAVLGIDASSRAISQINLELLQKLFEQFGTLHKIIIFMKEEIVKAFVEFAAPEMSANARSFLHNCTLNDLGKIKVFYSALQRLEFSGRFIESKDFLGTKTVPPAKATAINAHKAKVVASEILANQKSSIVLARQQKSAAGKTAEKQPLTVLSDFTNKQSKGNTDLSTSACTKMSIPSTTSLAILADNTSIANTPVKADENRPSLTTMAPLTSKTPSVVFKSENTDSAQPISKGNEGAVPTAVEIGSFDAEGQRSEEPANSAKVVLISNMEDCFNTASEIFNIFSCFGNIVRVLLMKNLKKALVEYKKPESAAVAISQMNNRSFGRSKIRVVASKYKKIDLKRNNKSENSQNYNEVIIVSNKMNRFKNSSVCSIQPSDTLLVVVERTENLRLTDVMLSLQMLAKPIRTKSLSEDSENEEVSLHKVLFKFPSTNVAMKVLAQAHNSEINGYFMNVTFAAPMNSV